MPESHHNSNEAKKRKQDICLALISLSAGVATAFWLSKALWATFCLVPATYFLLDWLSTLLTHVRIPITLRSLLQLALTAAIVFLGWHFYLGNLYRTQQAAVSEGDLAPEKAALDTTPIIQVGMSGGRLSFSSGTSSQHSLPPLVYRAILQASEGSKGIVLTTSVKDREGHLIVAIKNNHWVVYPPYCSDKNYTDNSLEVKDSSGEVVFQGVLIGSTAHIQGIWRDQFGAGEELVTDDNGTQFGEISWTDPSREERAEQQISPIFMYPSSQYWGEKVPALTVDDFDSTNGITISNNSSKPLIILDLKVNNETKNAFGPYHLNTEIDSHQTRMINLPAPRIHILRPTVGTFQDQWKEASDVYKNCVNSVFFFPVNQHFGAIFHASQAEHLTLAKSEAVGVVSYKARGTEASTTKSFNLVELIGIVEGCSP